MKKTKSKARVYVNRIVTLSIVAAILYGSYTAYTYYKPTIAGPIDVQPTQQNKELQAIMDSQAFKAKAQNLAEQQLIQDKIAQKQKTIADLQNEVGVLKGDLESKRVASLSL